jgi:hypothetical protein
MAPANLNLKQLVVPREYHERSKPNYPANPYFSTMGDTGLEPVTSALSIRLGGTATSGYVAKT